LNLRIWPYIELMTPLEIWGLFDEQVEWGSGGNVALERGCLGALEYEATHERFTMTMRSFASACSMWSVLWG
jgi:hypothetical protein